MHKKLTTALCLLAFLTSASLALRDLVPGPAPADRIESAARDLVAALSDEQRASGVLAFDDAYRMVWHYVPRARRGLRLDALADAPKHLAHDLLRATLSGHGYLQITSIIDLEATLRDLERAAGGDGAARDPGAYTYTFFGSPDHRPWAWRLEGHHISLNVLVAADGAVTLTPAFLGANPAVVPTGDKAGLQILADEEEVAYQLLHALSDAQRAEAVIGQTGRGDILLSPGKNVSDLGEPRGLAAAAMDDEQVQLFGRLVGVYAHRFQHDLARERLIRLGSADPAEVYFAWVGSTERGQPHYYRIHGPDWAIELDNTQGGNHVHTVWRDAATDFGGDVLVRHLQESHD